MLVTWLMETLLREAHWFLFGILVFVLVVWWLLGCCAGVLVGMTRGWKSGRNDLVLNYLFSIWMTLPGSPMGQLCPSLWLSKTPDLGVEVL